jgi:hypothetical protein
VLIVIVVLFVLIGAAAGQSWLITAAYTVAEVSVLLGIPVVQPRARYDADRTVTAFAARLKDTVDLNSVREDLAGVVDRALEPAHVSVRINERAQ